MQEKIPLRLLQGEVTYKSIKEAVSNARFETVSLCLIKGIVRSPEEATDVFSSGTLKWKKPTIYLLPALPDDWKDISVKGLYAKGKRKISLTVKNGVLDECIIEGSLPKRIMLLDKDIKDLFSSTGERHIYKA
jgi:hypothetical protein